MDLILDIGNTGIKGGLFDGDRLVEDFRLEADPRASSTAYRHSLRPHVAEVAVERCGLLSVVPDLTERIAEAALKETLIRPLRLTARMDAPVEPAYESITSLGVDRLAAAVGGFLSVRSNPEPVVVVDAGTALTTELVDADGSYLGGTITAGPELVVGALAERTALLDEIELHPPDGPAGRTTPECMRSGILFGTVDAIDGIVRRYEALVGASVQLLLTGGWADRLSPLLGRAHRTAPHLVLEGGRSLLERNA